MVRFHLSPPKDYLKKEDNWLAQYKRVVQGNWEKIIEIILNVYWENFLEIDAVIRSLDEAKKHIEKYIEKNR